MKSGRQDKDYRRMKLSSKDYRWMRRNGTTRPILLVSLLLSFTLRERKDYRKMNESELPNLSLLSLFYSVKQFYFIHWVSQNVFVSWFILSLGKWAVWENRYSLMLLWVKGSDREPLFLELLNETLPGTGTKKEGRNLTRNEPSNTP